MAFSKFLNHELLKLHHICNVKETFDLVQYHYAQLIRDAAITILAHHKEASSYELPAQCLAHIFIHVQVGMRRLWCSSSSHCSLCLCQRTQLWVK